MNFEWDDNKNKINQVKHGLAFEAVLTVFYDPFAIVEFKPVEGENRFQILGLAGGITIVAVVHTVRVESQNEETYRIISARKASKNERIRYEEAAE